MANPLVHEYPLVIREFHLDTFQHVNNAQYLALFEEARWQVITERGFGLKEINQTKTGPVLLDVTMRFKRELKLREKILIRTWVSEVKSKVTVLRQEMVNEAGQVCCEADFTVAFFDLGKRKIIEPSPEWKKALALD